MSDDCLFCKFVAGEIPTDVVLQNDAVFAFRDINPQAPVHVLIVPKRHVRDVASLGPDDGDLLSPLFAAARSIATSEGILTSGYRVVANVGPEAGQSVFHLHLHVLGGREMAWPPG